MNQPRRRPANDGGVGAEALLDRSTTLSFTFDGHPYTGFPGDTLASALLAAGVRTIGHSPYHHRPRGIYAAWAEDPNALVAIDSGPYPVPMAHATTVELYDGLHARSLAGKGVLPTDADTAGTGSDEREVRHDKAYLHADVLVVGGGSAGIGAALAAGESGARVILVDDQSQLGGDLLGSRAVLDDAPATRWVEEATARLAELPETTVFTRTTAVGCYDHNEVLAVERRTDHLGLNAPEAVSRQRLWHLRASEIVFATGAHERHIVFAGNDRPGIMLAAAARTYVNRYAVLPGTRAVVFTTNDTAYAAALDLLNAGVEIAAIVDVRPDATGPGGDWAALLRWRGVEVLRGQLVVDTHGDEHGELRGIHVAAPDSSRSRFIDCDLLAVSGGWNPAVHLPCQAQGQTAYDEGLAAFVPTQTAPGHSCAGALIGTASTASAIADGVTAGTAAARRACFAVPTQPRVPHESVRATEPAFAYWAVPAREAGDSERQYVDLARDATVHDLERAVRAGLRSVEHIKRFTTIGTASDQGKTSATVSTGIIAQLLRRNLADVGTTSARPPYVPVTIDTLAGRATGDLADPVRVTALHDWHVANGAVFEDVGQWKRPWYYPRQGANGLEDMPTAVLRECRAARESVALMDASTLGKIDVRGPDAAVFLDRIYTNMMSTLRVGRCRYGLMCSADGMVFDDGVAARIDTDHYAITTTTGNAAAVLDWLEEWLRTEWTDLRVFCTSTTDHWSTIAVVGPRSREVLRPLFPELELDADAFGFMTWRDARLAVGEDASVPVRVFRVSFSGELAFEINVATWYARPVWEAVLAAGEPYGITPYGTETMHVLRAEKGFAIVGQETDGTVTPYDLGMGWIVSSKKQTDFVGRRSFSRPDTARTDRRRLVGLLPDDTDDVLPEGAALVTTPGEPPLPLVGHVTSSYRSAVIGRTFALAMVHAGNADPGARLFAPLIDRVVPVTVTEPVFYDKEGSRRDG